MRFYLSARFVFTLLCFSFNCFEASSFSLKNFTYVRIRSFLIRKYSEQSFFFCYRIEFSYVTWYIDFLSLQTLILSSLQHNRIFPKITQWVFDRPCQASLIRLLRVVIEVLESSTMVGLVLFHLRMAVVASIEASLTALILPVVAIRRQPFPGSSRSTPFLWKLRTTPWK